MVTTSSALAQVDLNLGKAARNLGATGAQAFRTIALPQIRPAVMSGALFAFITSLDEVVISSFISGGENATLTKKMSSGLRHQVDPTSAAVSSLLIGVTGVLRLAVILLSRRGGDLSGGQQQQLAIGRALVTRPKVLVLDEPTEGIQPSIIKDIGRALQYLRDQKGISILLVEQYLDFCRELADKVYIMDRGEIVHEGPAESLDREEVRRHLTV